LTQNITIGPESKTIDSDTDVTPDDLAYEAFRVLKRAESIAETNESAASQLVSVADRYIRLTEMLLVHG
jgi:hypothetical protein